MTSAYVGMVLCTTSMLAAEWTRRSARFLVGKQMATGCIDASCGHLLADQKPFNDAAIAHSLRQCQLAALQLTKQAERVTSDGTLSIDVLTVAAFAGAPVRGDASAT